MHIQLIQVLYMVVVGWIVLSAVMTVTQNHPVRSVLFLVLTFFGTAILWLMLQAEFLSLVLVLVYVGAVMTLFLFVVMMLNVDMEALQSHLLRLLPLGLLIVGGLAALFILALKQTPLFHAFTLPSTMPMNLTIPQTAPQETNTEQIGMLLFTQYVYPFELAAVLLLVAMVAAITLTHRSVVRSKRQHIRHQIMTQAKDRLTLHTLTEDKDR